MTDEGYDAAIQPGSSGQFDVLRDDELVFSKQQVRRFPEPGEVLALLRS